MNECFKIVFELESDFAAEAATLDDEISTSLTVLHTECEGAVFAATRAELEDFVHSHGLPPEYLERIELVPEESWRDEWQTGLQQLEFARGLVRIAPLTKALEGAIILDPGRSFGIGHHPTTSMMIELMCEHRSKIGGKRIFDFGIGSGVLSIVAAQLGGDSIMGCDNDPEAIRVARENAERNGYLGLQFERDCTPGAGTEVLLINVLRKTAQDYYPKLQTQLAKNALVFASGFLSHEIEAVAAEMNVRILSELQREEWGAFVGSLRSHSEGGAPK